MFIKRIFAQYFFDRHIVYYTQRGGCGVCSFTYQTKRKEVYKKKNNEGNSFIVREKRISIEKSDKSKGAVNIEKEGYSISKFVLNIIKIIKFLFKIVDSI